MSTTITELIARLRSFAKLGEAMEKSLGQKRGELTKILFEAADTIEALRMKLSAYMLERTILYGDWIPCSERLPENRLYVLVTYKYEYGLIDHGITWYGQVEGKWNTSREVIAWMPLPEPYRGKSDD